MCDKYNNKILLNKKNNLFIIFYSPWCKYSTDAIQLLHNNNKSYKGYNIDKIKGGIGELLFCLSDKSNITYYNKNHKTRPIIFYKGKFIGGYDNLKNYLGLTL